MIQRTQLHARICGALAASGMLVLPPTSIGKVHAQTQIVEGFVSHGALQWPEYIASEFGWFKESGVSVDMLVVGAGAAQQVAAGALNLGYSGFPDFIRATNQGAPVKIVLNAISAPPYAVYAKPAIKQIADLKGKTVSIGGTKDVTSISRKPASLIACTSSTFCCVRMNTGQPWMPSRRTTSQTATGPFLGIRAPPQGSPGCPHHPRAASGPHRA